jgi:hypothetical protein
MVGDAGPAYDRLYDVGGVATCFESTGCDRCKVRRGPGRGFGAFDDDGVAGEYGGDDRADQVVELRLSDV